LTAPKSPEGDFLVRVTIISRTSLRWGVAEEAIQRNNHQSRINRKRSVDFTAKAQSFTPSALRKKYSRKQSDKINSQIFSELSVKTLRPLR